jgi:hypothetical protein
MSNEEILENNELIAEFVGGYTLENKSKAPGIVQPYIREGYVIYHSKIEPIKNEAEYSFKDLEYHMSWDWLMPVVDKIELITKFPVLIGGNVRIQSYNDYYYTNISYNSDGYTVSRYLDNDFDYTPLYTKHIQISKIEAVWLVVVEFIKWYNQNKND